MSSVSQCASWTTNQPDATIRTRTLLGRGSLDQYHNATQEVAEHKSTGAGVIDALEDALRDLARKRVAKHLADERRLANVLPALALRACHQLVKALAIPVELLGSAWWPVSQRVSE
jgi:hypothetical protein